MEEEEERGGEKGGRGKETTGGLGCAQAQRPPTPGAGPGGGRAGRGREGARVAKDAAKGPAGRRAALSCGLAGPTPSPRHGLGSPSQYCKLTINPDRAPVGIGKNLVLDWAGPKLNFPLPRGAIRLWDKPKIIKPANYKFFKVLNV